jgi:hypothetical protein
MVCQRISKKIAVNEITKGATYVQREIHASLQCLGPTKTSEMMVQRQAGGNVKKKTAMTKTGLSYTPAID